MSFDVWKENEKVNFEGVFFMRNGPDLFSFVCGAGKAMATTQREWVASNFFSGLFCPLILTES